MYKKIIVYFLGVTFIMSCGKSEKSAQLKKIEGKHVARVGDSVLPQAAFDYLNKQKGSELSEDDKNTIIENWTESALLAEEAKTRGFDKIDDYLWQMEQAKLNILTQLLIGSIKEKIKESITEDEIKKFYNEKPQFFNKPGKVHARHILIPLERDAGIEQETKALEEIKRIREEALAPGTDFKKLAEKYNSGVSKESGGDLGWFSKDEMIEPISKAAFSLKIGEISQIIKTQFGYHILQLLARDVQPLEEVSNEIKDELTKKKMETEVKNLIEELRKKYKVEIKK
ncbi:MAG: peptidylprolyl isomerase [Candidatus Hydrogenedentota bacterium]